MVTTDKDRKKEMIGKTFGKWTVLDGPVRDGKWQQISWNCKCSCGVEKVVSNTYLKKNINNCNKCRLLEHENLDNLIGQKFGNWTVIKITNEKNKKNHSVIKVVCECPCKNQQSYLASRFKRNRYGRCLKCNVSEKRKGYKTSYWWRIKRNAYSRKIELEIEFDEVMNLLDKQEWKCAISGLPIKFPINASNKYRKEGTASLDRIDSSKGYTIDNVQWLHKDINMLKTKFPQSQFIEYCHAVSTYQKSKDDQ